MVKLSVLALNGRLSRRSACVCYQGGIANVTQPVLGRPQPVQPQDH